MINQKLKHKYSGAKGTITQVKHSMIKTSKGEIIDISKPPEYLIEWENGSNTWYTEELIKTLTVLCEINPLNN